MIITKQSELAEILRALKQELYIAVDLETTGINPRKDKIIGIAIATKTSEFYIVLRSWVDNKLIDVVPESALAPLMQELKHKRLLGHNWSFDSRFLYCQLGIDLIKQVHCDTMLLAHTINENRFDYGLKTLAKEFFGDSAANEQKDMLESIKANGGTKSEFYKADTTLMGKYAMQDVRLTYKLWELLDPQLDKEGLRDFFYKDEVMPLLRFVTIPMELRGIPVNVEALKTSQTEIAADIADLEFTIQTAIKPLITGFEKWYIETKFPVKFTGPFKDKLAAYLAPPNWPKTESGKYSLNKADITRAIKKGLISSDSQLLQIINGVTRVPEELAHKIQVELAHEQAGTYIFNLQSKDHLKRLFFGTNTTESVLNEKPLSRTEKGAPQVDDEFLDAMARKYEWAQWLRTYNRLNKLKSTYVDGILEKQDDGIFYPQFFQHRTVSGRFGSDMQQLPRKLEENQAEPLVVKYTNRIRDFFIAGPGYKLIGDDYESLEPKVFSHVTGDEGLINIFLQGHDFYSTIAISTEGLHEYSADKKAPNYLGKLNKQKRQTAKAYSLGTPYGLSGYKLSLELGISKEEGERLVAQYVNAFPKLKKWMQDSIDIAIRDGKIKSQAGRIRRFPELRGLIAQYGTKLLNSLEIWKEYHEVEDIYQAVKKKRKIAQNCLNNARNFQIQSLAASIVNRAAIAMTKAFDPKWGAYVCAQIHDELVIRCRAEYAAEVAACVQHAMENTTKLSLPLVAEPCIADVYGETK